MLNSPVPNIFNEHRSALKLGLLHMLSKNVRLPVKRNKPVGLPLEINSHSSSSRSRIYLIGDVAKITQREKSGTEIKEKKCNCQRKSKEEESTPVTE